MILPFHLLFYGFLAALFTFTTWAVLQTLNEEVPKYCDQISSPGLTVFPKPGSALGYSFTVSDPEPHKGYAEDLKKLLKQCALEGQKHLAACPDGVSVNRRGPFMLHVSFLPPYFKHAVVW